MSFTASTIKQRIHKPQGGGLIRVTGNAVFNGTDASGDVDCMLGTILGYSVHPVGSPGLVTEPLQVPVGALSATGDKQFIFPAYSGSVASAYLAAQTAITRDDTNFWTFRLINKGNADADMILATDANTTKLTRLNLAAFTATALGLHGTAANLAFTANQVGLFTATKAGTAANLDDLVLNLNLTTGALGEHLYLDQAADFADGVLKRPADGVLTFTRKGPSITSALPVAFSYWGF